MKENKIVIYIFNDIYSKEYIIYSALYNIMNNKELLKIFLDKISYKISDKNYDNIYSWLKYEKIQNLLITNDIFLKKFIKLFKDSSNSNQLFKNIPESLTNIIINLEQKLIEKNNAKKIKELEIKNIKSICNILKNIKIENKNNNIINYWNYTYELNITKNILWKDILYGWKNGIIMKYPKSINQRFLWNTSVLKNNGDIEYKQNFLIDNTFPSIQNENDFSDYINKSKKRFN
jgi:hypothetical protein